MLKKEYKSAGFSLKITLDNEKELPLRNLMNLEAEIASLVENCICYEELINEILKDKANGQANP